MQNEFDPQSTERLAQIIAEVLAGRLPRREVLRRCLALGLGLPAAGVVLAACGLEQTADEAGRISDWRPPAAPAASPAPLRATLQPVGQSSPETLPATPETLPAPAVRGAQIRVAVIGDYGMEGEPAAAVGALVSGWAPDAVLTLGDNNYPAGAAATIDGNVGRYYSGFIAPYNGAFGAGAAENRFFPVLGNHDWVVGYPEPYLSYFAPPGNGRYYRVDRGPLSICCIDSMPGEPDGWTADSLQAAWLREELAAAPGPWKVVAMHHPPYSSGFHGSADWMRWPFAAWGAQLVLAGHDHTYERILRDEITYVVNGLGGAARYAAGFQPVEGSAIFFNAEHGALLISADDTRLQLQFVTASGRIIDDVVIA